MQMYMSVHIYTIHMCITISYLFPNSVHNNQPSSNMYPNNALGIPSLSKSNKGFLVK